MRTELPKKWYVNPKNVEQDKILTIWRGGGHAGHFSNSAICYEKYWVYYPANGYEEITFEEFQVLVLKEQIQSTEPYYEIY